MPRKLLRCTTLLDIIILIMPSFRCYFDKLKMLHLIDFYFYITFYKLVLLSKSHLLRLSPTRASVLPRR